MASTLDEQSVYLSRTKLGEELAKAERGLDLVNIDPDDTIIVPVPDTSKAAADSMAYQLSIPCCEGLIRNRYAGRTFIEGGRARQKRQLNTLLSARFLKESGSFWLRIPLFEARR